MPILTTTTKSLEALLTAAPATTQPVFMASAVEDTGSTVNGIENDGSLNGVTAVTVIDAPSGSNVRKPRSIIITNIDTAPVSGSLQLNNNGTKRQFCSFSIGVRESFFWGPRGAGIITLRGRGRTRGGQIIHDHSHICHISGSSGIAANYPLGAVSALAFSNLTMTANQLYARPFIAPLRKAPVLERVGAYISTGVASANVRIGIYENIVGQQLLYPGLLLYDSDNLDASVSSTARTATANLTLKPGKIYWAVIFSSSTAALRSGQSNCPPGFGWPDSLNSSGVAVGFAGTFSGLTFGAFPTNFPPGIVTLTTALPFVFGRFSA